METVAYLQISTDKLRQIALVRPRHWLRSPKTGLGIAHLFSVQEIAHVPA
jgi:hypothetical protein